MGDKSCVHRSATAFTTREGKHVVIRQMQRCATASRQRLIWPENGLLSRGDTEIGPHMNCSNGFRLPRGFKRPHIDF
ncbi:hypothetical protein [Streptomyces albospinus]|uniref:hypothetical protein n=1 Tax=Streptomyces albospinus TaxID=285515 RepID=UPI001E2DA8EC|nr:hypothetical protein [Streptomyces albospinus]